MIIMLAVSELRKRCIVSDVGGLIHIRHDQVIHLHVRGNIKTTCMYVCMCVLYMYLLRGCSCYYN